MYNTPIIQKRLHFNTNTSGGFRKNYGYSAKDTSSVAINTDNLKLGDLSNTRSYSVEEQISITFTHEIIEVGTRVGLRYSNTLNNLKPTVEITKDWSAAGNIVLHLPYNINIGSDLNYTNRQGYPTAVPTELLWNATIDKTVFKSKGVISLKATDMLRQKLNIRQTIGDNYIQYNTYNTLTSYFLLNFTYKINKFSGMKDPGEMQPDNRFGPSDRPRRGEGGERRGGFGGGHEH
jgi:hypothetical protein